jgi:hypothetical protein
VTSGFVNLTTYSTIVTPVFSGGSATLNGVPYTSNTSINRIGNHILIITGRPGFTSTFNFTIASTSTNFSNDDLKAPNFEPEFFGEAVSITLNEVSYQLGTPINEPGNHTLVVNGVNGYSTSYSFAIELVTSGFVNLTTYSTIVTPVFSGGSATLNGVPYTSNSEVKLIGHYDLVVSGRPGFLQEFRFTIEPDYYYEDGEVLSSPVLIDYPNATQVKINGIIHANAYRIETQREYEIEISGVNGYVLAFTIQFINPNRTDVQTLIAPLLGTAIGTIGLYFLRRRWVK